LFKENGEPVLDSRERLDAVDRVLKAAAQKSRLLGLDAPTQSQQHIQVTQGDAQTTAQREADAVLARFTTLTAVPA
jgi:hypothetical protein